MKVREQRIGREQEALLGWTRHTRVFTYGKLFIMMSDDDDFGDGEKWRHVSISARTRKPSYDEMYKVRKHFFPDDAEVVQVFPPRAEHVNNHPHCLHLWWNKSRRLTPRNMADAVGIKGVGPLAGE
jgi:hypothetical protein